MIGEPSPLVVANFKCAGDKFCPDTNPEGIIDFGTAENHLTDNEMLESLYGLIFQTTWKNRALQRKWNCLINCSMKRVSLFRRGSFSIPTHLAGSGSVLRRRRNTLQQG